MHHFDNPNDPVLQRETGKIRMYELRQMRHAQWVLWRPGPAWASVTPVLSRAERGATRGQLSLASASNTQSPVTVSHQGNISSECFVLSPWPERQTRNLSIWTKRKKRGHSLLCSPWASQVRVAHNSCSIIAAQTLLDYFSELLQRETKDTEREKR